MGSHSVKSPRRGGKHLVKILGPTHLHRLRLHRKTHLLQLGQDAFLTYANFLFKKGLMVGARRRIHQHKDPLRMGLARMPRNRYGLTCVACRPGFLPALASKFKGGCC